MTKLVKVSNKTIEALRLDLRVLGAYVLLRSRVADFRSLDGVIEHGYVENLIGMDCVMAMIRNRVLADEFYGYRILVDLEGFCVNSNDAKTKSIVKSTNCKPTAKNDATRIDTLRTNRAYDLPGSTSEKNNRVAGCIKAGPSLGRGRVDTGEFDSVSIHEGKNIFEKNKNHPYHEPENAHSSQTIQAPTNAVATITELITTEIRSSDSTELDAPFGERSIRVANVEKEACKALTPTRSSSYLFDHASSRMSEAITAEEVSVLLSHAGMRKPYASELLKISALGKIRKSVAVEAIRETIMNSRYCAFNYFFKVLIAKIQEDKSREKGLNSVDRMLKRIDENSDLPYERPF